MMPGNSDSPAASFMIRLSRTSFFTERLGNAPGDDSRARRRSPVVLIFEGCVIGKNPENDSLKIDSITRIHSNGRQSSIVGSRLTLLAVGSPLLTFDLSP